MGFISFVYRKRASRKNEQKHHDQHTGNSASYSFHFNLSFCCTRQERIEQAICYLVPAAQSVKSLPSQTMILNYHFLLTLSTYPCKCKYIIEFQPISAVSRGTFSAPAHILTPAAAPTYPGWCGAPRRLGALYPRYAGRHKHRAAAGPKKAQREAKAEWRSATGEQGQ